MVRKIAALAGAGALLLAVAGPAFANFWPWPPFGNDNIAFVENSAVAIADTGGNTQDVKAWKGGDVEDANGSRYISTGNASAYAGALVVANTHIGCDLCGDSHDDDIAVVGNDALAGAYTGDNSQDVKAWKGGDVDDADGSRTIVTGYADSTARAWVIVNTHWH